MASHSNLVMTTVNTYKDIVCWEPVLAAGLGPTASANEATVTVMRSGSVVVLCLSLPVVFDQTKLMKQYYVYEVVPNMAMMIENFPNPLEILEF